MIFIYSLDGAQSLIYQIEDWKGLITSAFTLSAIVLQINKGRSSNENDEDHSRDLVASGMKSQIATNWANEASLRWIHTNENKVKNIILPVERSRICTLDLLRKLVGHISTTDCTISW